MSWNARLKRLDESLQHALDAVAFVQRLRERNRPLDGETGGECLARGGRFSSAAEREADAGAIDLDRVDDQDDAGLELAQRQRGDRLHDADVEMIGADEARRHL